MRTRWDALVLAAGRGADDPLARAYGVPRKCLLPVGGVPMLDRVIATLRGRPEIDRVVVSMESDAAAARNAGFVPAAASAPASVLAAISGGAVRFPVLVTTADHPLLTGAMLSHFLGEATRSGADLCAGLATAETILAAYPEAKRTYLAFGKERVSGCNLFALRTEGALKAVDLWSDLDKVRKKPWRLVGAFGPVALLRFAIGGLSLSGAFATASARLGINARPVLMPFAEAAIDVDKPEDKELAERILSRR